MPTCSDPSRPTVSINGGALTSASIGPVMRSQLFGVGALLSVGCAHAFVPSNPELVIRSADPIDGRIALDRHAGDTWEPHWVCGAAGDVSRRPSCHGEPGLPPGEYRLRVVDVDPQREHFLDINGSERRIDVFASSTSWVSVYGYASPVALTLVDQQPGLVTVRATNLGTTTMASSWYRSPDHAFWVEPRSGGGRDPAADLVNVCALERTGFELAPNASIELTAELPEHQTQLRFVLVVFAVNPSGEELAEVVYLDL